MMEAFTDMPLHAIVRRDLLADLDSGRLRPGDQIPTEPELIERYRVSRTTVRRALRDLEVTGRIVRRPGRGSFVREPPLEPQLNRLTGFVEDMNTLGLTASARVVLIEDIAANHEVATSLRLNSGTTVVHIQRVRLAGGKSISLDDSFLRVDIGHRVAQEDLERDPFYSIIEDKYNLSLDRAEYLMSASLADESIASLLDISPNAPILRLDRTTYLSDRDHPIIFEHLHYRGDALRYRLKLTRAHSGPA